MRILCISHFLIHTFFQQNISVFVIFMFEILTNLSLTNDVIKFEQLGPEQHDTHNCLCCNLTHDEKTCPAYHLGESILIFRGIRSDFKSEITAS